MNLLLVAAVTGFLAGEFASTLVAENIAHEFEDLYANGFYIVPPTPEVSLANATTDSEEAYLARLCRLPDAQSADTVNSVASMN